MTDSTGQTVLTEQEYRRIQIERMAANAAALDAHHVAKIAAHKAADAALQLAVQVEISRMWVDAIIGPRPGR